jgi:hypothetical protein
MSARNSSLIDGWERPDVERLAAESATGTTAVSTPASEVQPSGERRVTFAPFQDQGWLSRSIMRRPAAIHFQERRDVDGLARLTAFNVWPPLG